jgi:hypothetical protein
VVLPEDVKVSIKILNGRLRDLRDSNVEVRCEGTSLEYPVNFWCKLPQGTLCSSSIYIVCTSHQKIGNGSSNQHLCKPHPAQSALNTSSRHHMNLAKIWLEECSKKLFTYYRGDSSFTPTRLVHVGSHDRRIPIHLSVLSKRPEIIR